MKTLLHIATSIRTAAVLMLVLAILLLAGLVVPQRSVLGDKAVDAISATSAAHHFVIDTLGLARIATSPVFIAALVLFYANLVAVLVRRMPAMLGRMRVRRPTPEAASRWLASPHAIEGKGERAFDAAQVVATLRGFGYRPQRVDSSTLFAVKHRSAAMGFLLFHLSFFFLFAGGLAIWYTRWVGQFRVVEGQTADAASAHVLRARPAGGTPALAFTLERMKPSFDRQEMTDLHATLRIGSAAPVEAWVNHPAKDGAASLLVEDVGIAPVFWLQDSRGFGLDRVTVPVTRSGELDVPLVGGIVRVHVLPAPPRMRFPARDELQHQAVSVVVSEAGREVFRGALRPGEAAALPGSRLVLTEVRYWAGIKLVSERGGAILIIGFVLATIGATWRLLFHRRDLVIGWTGHSFRLAGHGEWFADRDRRELMRLAGALERRPAPATVDALPTREVIG